MSSPSADALQRAYLEARRCCLAGQIDALRAEAFRLWQRAHAQLLAGEDPTPLERLACEAHSLCRQAAVALVAIDDELGACGEA